MMNWISTVISCNLFNGNLVQMMPRKSIQLSCLLKQPATIQKNLCLSLFHLKKTYKETSQFYSDDPELFNSLTLKENILVDITANASTLSSEYRKLSSDLHAPLSLNETVLSPLYKSKETLKLSPHTKVTTECKIYIKEYTATYLAIFENDKGETIEMSGKWKGAFNKGSKVTYILKDIK